MRRTITRFPTTPFKKSVGDPVVGAAAGGEAASFGGEGGSASAIALMVVCDTLVHDRIAQRGHQRVRLQSSTSSNSWASLANSPMHRRDIPNAGCSTASCARIDESQQDLSLLSVHKTPSTFTASQKGEKEVHNSIRGHSR